MHHQSVEQVLATLGTSARGLDAAEIERRRAAHGANVIDEAEKAVRRRPVGAGGRPGGRDSRAALSGAAGGSQPS